MSISTAILPPPRPLSAPLDLRQPLTPTRDTQLSVHLFQARHALQFAHLHTDAPTFLEAENSHLEEERRIGRGKRESLALHSPESQNTQGQGRRPLSLVGKHSRSRSQLGITRPTSHQIHRGRGGSLQISTGTQIRCVSDEPLRPLSESEVEPEFELPQPSPPILAAPRNTLTISIKSSHPSDSAQPHSSPSSTPSIPQSGSTYSWASSFSGETSELRTAAHYVPESSSTPDIISITNSTDEQNHTEYLNSPEREKTDRRRKRIVAIAHTVRQLEGVGSREEEDPELYGVLVKAWNERHGLNIPAVPTPAYVPDSQAQGGEVQYDVASPPDPDFRTPSMDGEGSFSGSGSGSSMTGSGDLSRSIRYSYASTLHDLAMDGGVELGGRLMREKAWLRGSGGVGLGVGLDEAGRFAHDQGMEFSPPPPPFLPPAETRRLESPINLPGQGRILRRLETSIPLRPGYGEAGPSRLLKGSGFTNAWWDASQGAEGESGGVKADFHQGEVNPDKALYTTPPRERRISHLRPRRVTRRMSGTEVLDSGQGLGVGLGSLELGSPIDLDLGRRGERGSRCLSHCRRNTIHSIISSNQDRGLQVQVGDGEVEEDGEEEGDGSIGLDKSSLQLTPVQIVRASISKTPSATPIYTRFTRYNNNNSKTINDPSPTLGYESELNNVEEGIQRDYPFPASPIQDDYQFQACHLETPANQTIPSNLHPLHHHRLSLGSSSYRGMSGGNGIPLPMLEDAESVGVGNLPTTVAGKQKSRVHTPPLHTILTAPVMPVADVEGLRGDDQLSAVHCDTTPAKSKRKTPPVLFFLGFLFPLLWIIGGWVVSRNTLPSSDIEQGGALGIQEKVVQDVRLGAWYSRWARHPNPWVKRCRIATAVSVPILVAGGILVGVLVPTLG